MGDCFNAHIGQSYSDRIHGQTNTQGHLFIDLMNCTGHYAVSLSDVAKGPPMSTFFLVETKAQQWTAASLTVGPPTW